MSDVNFENIDDLLNASMDDLDDLPPIGVPPSGHYNLTVTASIEDVGEDKRKLPCVSFVVDAVNELKDESERDEVREGQQFRQMFFLTKKDGTKNVMGIGQLKQMLAPFADRFGTQNIGELISNVKQVAVTATVIRKPNKKDPDQYNLTVKDVVLL